MGDRPTITTLPAGGRYDVSTLNSNFTSIRNKFDDLIGRNGTGGSNNTASGNMDLNGNNILNVGDVLNTSGTGFISSVDYAEEWANKAEDSLVSSAAGGDLSDDYSSLHWSKRANYYATKTDGVVSGTSDHSAKAWAIGGTGVTDTAGKGAAKEWATEAEDNTVDGTNYSAKHWSAKASAHSTTAAGEASAVAPKYTFSTTTSMADPGAGILRYNHGTVASVTAIAIDDTTADTGNPDIEAWIASWDDSSSTIKGQLRLVEPGTPANYAVFNVTALTNNSGWVQLTVAHVDSNGTFGNTDSIRVSFARTGDIGVTGATGSGEGLELTFETATADSDQGAGKVWYNNGTVSSATVFYIDDVDANAVNINSFVDSWDDSGSSVKGRLVVKKQTAPENYHMFNVTGAVTSASTYSKIAVTHVVSTGTISDGDAIFVSFSRTGDKGDTGSTGATGEVSEATAVALAIALG